MISVKLLSLFSLDLLPQNQALSSSVSAGNILELTNFSRQAYGLKALQNNVLLEKAAQAKAEDMLKNQYFSHNSPGGALPWDFIKAQGYNYIIAGENLAINFYNSESLENAWMNSPGHKANILNHDFEDIGIGVAQGTYKGNKAILVVQMFGSSADQPIQTKVAYSELKQFASMPSIAVPTPSRIALAAPIIAGSDFKLTNQKTYQVHGYAPEASAIYIVVNNIPQQKLSVVDGEYRGEISLSEGANKITAISFNDQNQASALAKSINIQLDSVAPTVQASVQPVISNGEQQYVVEARAPNNVTKIIATLGDQNIMLQPGANPEIWTGTFVGSSAELQGGLAVKSYDLVGNAKVNVIASFNDSVKSSYGFLAQKDYKVNVLGKNYSIKAINNLYIYFVLFMLTALILAVAVKRKVQHLGLIAHASGMIMVAMLLWLT